MLPPEEVDVPPEPDPVPGTEVTPPEVVALLMFVSVTPESYAVSGTLTRSQVDAAVLFCRWARDVRLRTLGDDAHSPCTHLHSPRCGVLSDSVAVSNSQSRHDTSWEIDSVGVGRWISRPAARRHAQRDSLPSVRATSVVLRGQSDVGRSCDVALWVGLCGCMASQ